MKLRLQLKKYHSYPIDGVVTVVINVSEYYLKHVHCVSRFGVTEPSWPCIISG